MGRNSDIEPARNISLVFGIERRAVVLGVPEHEEVPTVRAFRNIDARLIRDGNQLEVRVPLDVFGVNARVA